MKILIKGIESTMSELLGKINKERTALLKKAADELAAKLAVVTPVDTGEAMRGWNTAVIDGKVYINNDVPHIAILNEGHSKQAPAYFVERTLLQNGRAVGTLVKTTPG